MKTLKEKLEVVKQTRRELLKLMQRLPKSNAAIAPDSAYYTAEKRLQKGEVKVAFCGQTNCGKSTLINSIIGKDILPTGNRPITSRVVEVSNCASVEDEGFVIVMNDGSENSFTNLSDLARFAVEDDRRNIVEGVCLSHISHIELKCHIPNLPQGISIVDTPGTASVHKEHSALANYYLSKADAVVYVVRSDAPLMECDVEFIKNIKSDRRNIILVQTMIDSYGLKASAEIKARNLEILNAQIGLDEKDVAYFMLAPNLRNQENDYLRQYNAEYPAFIQEWERLLFCTAGVDDLRYAFACVSVYIQENLRIFDNQLESARSDTAAKNKCIEAAKKVYSYQSEWMNSGSKITQLLSDLEKAVLLIKQDIVDFMDKLQQSIENEIVAVQSKDEAKRVATSIPERVNVCWKEVQDRCVDRINGVLQKLAVSTPYVSCGKLLKDGQFIHLDMKEFGGRDAWRLFKAGVHALYGNVVGVITNIGLLIISIFNREAANRRRREQARGQLQNLFGRIKEGLRDECSGEKGVIAAFYSMGVGMANKTVTERYMSLAQESVGLLCLAQQDTVRKAKLVEYLEPVKESWQKLQQIVELKSKPF